MARKPKRPRDMSQLAKRIVDLTTGEASEEERERAPKERRASRGGKARAEALSAEERARIARKAARARWSKD